MTETAPAEQAWLDGRAWVDGVPVSPARAISASAALLAASRSAVVAGLGTDVAGARASVALAQAIGGSVDHMDARAVFANLEVMRRAGWIVTTPLQARSRADTVLLVGDGLPEAWPEMAARLALDAPPALTGGSRLVFHLCPGASTVDPGAIAQGKPVLPTLAALRALVSGRPTSLDDAAAAPLRALAAALKEARFGVAIWAAAAFDTLAVEMLCGLIDDLNKQTRFAGLPLAPANGAEAVTHALTWTTGFPPRTGFASAAPLHDPWRFDAQRLVGSGEADAAVWISALSRTTPPWGDVVPTVALVRTGTVFAEFPAVVFEVGCPGQDHDSMLFDQALGGIAFAAAPAPSAVASVAGVLAAITAALPSC